MVAAQFPPHLRPCQPGPHPAGRCSAAGPEGERSWDDIIPLLHPSDADQQYAIIYRGAFFRDGYEDAPVELPCEFDEADRHDTTYWMIRCIEHDVVMCPRHWCDHYRNIHGGRACQRLEEQVAAGRGDTP